MPHVTVTTSWDDGHTFDIALAELLNRYHIAGTFYIAPRDRNLAVGERLTDSQLRNLSGGFEIGAHTMTHPRLTAIDPVTARAEICDSRSYLQDVTGTPVDSFCYPAGYYQRGHVAMVGDAGFRYARTVSRFATTVSHPLEAGTTVHAYRHWSDVIPVLRHSGPVGFARQYLQWDVLACSLFDAVARSGGVFHLWGHSWEIERNGDWSRLERVLKHISDRDGVRYVTNGQLIQP